MKHIKSIADLRSEIDILKNKSRGLVPTMGALHEGHLSLVRRSLEKNDLTIISIFVNPTQFNDASDLEKYPRTIESDIRALSGIIKDDDIVFSPEYEDIYSNEKIPDIDLGKLDKVMEGEHRPGHFMGVVRIVKILFDLCMPHRAYFGRKDFQQLAVIKEMVRQTKTETEIIGCPIIREENGLAMSSRNTRLPADLRSRAGMIYHTLNKYSRQESLTDIEELRNSIINEINSDADFRVEYFEIVDDIELKPLRNVSDIEAGKDYTGCIAVYAGKVRLIDNVGFSFPFAKG